MKVLYVKDEFGEGYLVCPFCFDALEQVIYTSDYKFMGFDCQNHGIMLTCASEEDLYNDHGCCERICKNSVMKFHGGPSSDFATQEGCSSGKHNVDVKQHYKCSLLRFHAFGNSDKWKEGDDYSNIIWKDCDVLNSEALPKDFEAEINYGGVYLFFRSECTECGRKDTSFLANM